MSTDTIAMVRFEPDEPDELADAREVATYGVLFAAEALDPGNVFEPRWMTKLHERLPVRRRLGHLGDPPAVVTLSQAQAALLAEMAREMLDENEDLAADLAPPFGDHEDADNYTAMADEHRRKAEAARRTLRVLSERSSTR